MKSFISVILIILTILISGYSSTLEKKIKNESIALGNTNGNILNHGYMLNQLVDGYTIVSFSGMLIAYKDNADKTAKAQQKQMPKDTAEYLNKYGNLIFYISTHDHAIYKVNMDSPDAQKEKVYSGPVESMLIIGDSIAYTKKDGNSFNLFLNNLDFTRDISLVSLDSPNINYDNHTIFYWKADGTIHKIDVDAKNDIQVISGVLDRFQIYNSDIYALMRNSAIRNDNSMFRLSSNGHNEKILDGIADNFNIYNDKIYFTQYWQQDSYFTHGEEPYNYLAIQDKPDGFLYETDLNGQNKRNVSDPEHNLGPNAAQYSYINIFNNGVYVKDNGTNKAKGASTVFSIN